MLNAPTELMKNLGYGKNYSYDHDFANSFSGQNYFPDEMERFSFYKPKETGFEREIIKRLQYWEKLRLERSDRKLNFDGFIGVDWSGAKGPNLPGYK